MTRAVYEDGVLRECTPEEIAELEARAAAIIPLAEYSAPTKEELLAQLQALQTQIQSLE